MPDDTQQPTAPPAQMQESEMAKAFVRLAGNPKELEAVRKLLSKDEGIRKLLYRTNRPKGTYYRIEYGLQLKPFLDQIDADHSLRITFRLAKFPTLTLGSLYLRILQSIRWLVDSEKIREQFGDKYINIYDAIQMKKNKTKGEESIYIVWRAASIEAAGPLTADIDKNEKPDERAWRSTLDTWLGDQDAKPNPLELKNLKLTPDEVDELDLELSELPGIICRIRTDSIKVIRHVDTPKV